MVFAMFVRIVAASLSVGFVVKRNLVVTPLDVANHVSQKMRERRDKRRPKNTSGSIVATTETDSENRSGSTSVL